MENFSLDNCFPFPFVGLHGCNLPEPVSNLYVNDLPGLGIDKIAQLTDAESPRVADKFKSIHRLALSEFLGEITNKLSDLQVEFNSTIGETSMLGAYGDTVICHDYDTMGYIVEKAIDDPLAILFIGNISFIPLSEGTAKVQILDKGVVQKEVLQAMVPGIPNFVYLDYGTYSKSLEVILYPCDFEVLDSYCDGVGEACCINRCYLYECPCFSAKPMTKKTGEPTLNVPGNGMKIQGGCICDPTTLFCLYRQNLAVAFRYKLGIAIVQDALVTDNLTPFTTATDDHLNKLLNMWWGSVDTITRQFRPGAYTIARNNAVSGIKKAALKVNSECMSCTGYQFQTEVY